MKTKFTDGFNRTKTRARFRMSNANMSYRQLGKSAAHAHARTHAQQALSTGASREAPVDNACLSAILATSNLGILGLGIQAEAACRRAILKH